MAIQQLAQEDYADPGQRTNPRQYPHTHHETRTHSIHGRKNFGGGRGSGGVNSMLENKHTLWLGGGKLYTRAAALFLDPAGYRKAALKQLWGGKQRWS